MAGDASFDKVVLLLHGDGLNGSAAVRDYGPSARPVSADSALITTANWKFGNGSISLNGSSSFMSVPMDAAFQVGGGDFTIECFVYLAGTPSAAYAFASSDNHDSKGFVFLIDPTRRLSFSTAFAAGITGTVSYQSSSAIPLNTWSHLAVARNGQVISMYIDGVLNLEFTFTSAGANPFPDSTGSTFEIGRANSTWYFNGCIDEWRMTKGVARYTGTFTPPTAAFPDGMGQVAGTVKDSTGAPAARMVRAYRRIDGVLMKSVYTGGADANYNSVSLLMHCDGGNGTTAMVDSSPNAKAITALANAKHSVAQSKFGGSSLVLDGASYCTTPMNEGFNFGAGDFTIEGWVYLTGTPTAGNYFTLCGCLIASGSGWRTLIDSNRRLLGMSAFWSFSDLVEVTPPSAVIPLNTWTHIAWVRSGTNVYTFVDGVQDSHYTAASNQAINNSGSSTFEIGRHTTGTWYMNGYIDDLRITKDEGRYTANFTPPADRFPDRASGALGDYSFYTPLLDELTLVALDSATSGTIFDDICERVIPA